MDRILVSSVLWIAFIETASAAIATWDAAGATKESDSAAGHVVVSLCLWVVALAFAAAAVRYVPWRALFGLRTPPPA